jgi:hypothetical protein
MNKSKLFLLFVAAGAVAYACGGTTSAPDDGGADATSNDSGGADSGGADAGGGDGGGFDAGPVDDAGCYQYATDTCDGGCPTDTVCVTRVAGPGTVSGCYPVGQCSGSISLCSCIGNCVCPQPGYTGCQQGSGGLMCQGGPVSRREFKTDIDYVTGEQQKALADQALHTRLAEYRYKADAAGDKKHLGFIIDDMPAQSPAVQGDATHVDLYGYTSMLLATVQQQQKQIDALKKQVDALSAAQGKAKKR